MSTPLLPSFRRQQLVLDYASILPLLPEGIYLSLSPSNPALWSGVLFIRDPGPYESLVARFTISFPPAYPETVPVVIFQTDIFHPLIVPHTTYTFSGAWDSAGVSAGDVDGRLPPGAFALKYGFPHWFEEPGAVPASARSSFDNTPSAKKGLGLATSPASTPTQHTSSPSLQSPAQDTDASTTHPSNNAPSPPFSLSSSSSVTLAVISHVLASFTTPTLFDALPLSSSGNPSAWHAWRSHRGLTHTSARGRSPASSPTPASHTSDLKNKYKEREEKDLRNSPRHPSEWNWDGVFESRVRDCVENSISEAILFGHSSGARGNLGYDNISTSAQGQGGPKIRFEKLDREKLEEIRRDVRDGRTTVS